MEPRSLAQCYPGVIDLPEVRTVTSRVFARRLTRMLLVAFLGLAGTSCDRFNATTIVVPPRAAGINNPSSSDRVIAVARAVLAEHGFVKEEVQPPLSEHWFWRDPANPPGVRVGIVIARTGVEIRVRQDLLGPIGPTKRYRSLVDELVKRLGASIGRDHIRVE